MALQPDDLQVTLKEQTQKVCNELEDLIDREIRTYYTGETVNIDLSSEYKWTVCIENELKKRYHGWLLEYSSWYDQLDGDHGQFIKLTPKKGGT